MFICLNCKFKAKYILLIFNQLTCSHSCKNKTILNWSKVSQTFGISHIFSAQETTKLRKKLFSCCCSVAKSCPTLCNPMDCSILEFPVLHYLLEFAQVHVHGVGDAIQPSHPLSSPSPQAFHLSQHQGIFQWVCSLPHMTKGLELQHQSFQRIFMWLEAIVLHLILQIFKF